MTSNSLTSHRSGSLTGSVRIPGDKSISHRALMLGALACGQTTIEGLLESDDVLATAGILRQLGAKIEGRDGHWQVVGCGSTGFEQPTSALDFGNSGTSARLMMGVITGHAITARFIGDHSLTSRPMGRILDPLARMGLILSGGTQDQSNGDRLPLTLQGTSNPNAIRYELPVASAQVKSAVLLAGLRAHGKTTVVERAQTRDHTERMLQYFGAQVEVLNTGGGASEISLVGPVELHGQNVTIPADPSSAAFLVAAALVVPGSELTIANVLVNPTRIGFYETLMEMGANITMTNKRCTGGEDIADLRVTYGPLHGVEVPADRAPRMIDEYPVLSVVAAFASGPTKMNGLGELRVKECDRLAVTASGLRANGVTIEEGPETLEIAGDGRIPGGGTVDTELDHRIAMSFLTLGMGAVAPVTVDDTTMIATSFPEYIDLLTGVGATFTESNAVPAK